MSFIFGEIIRGIDGVGGYGWIGLSKMCFYGGDKEKSKKSLACYK